MYEIDLKKSTLGGLTWKLLENLGTQVINFIIQVILARILMPEDYGVIALTGIFIIIANAFVQTGFSSALIQKKSVSNIEYSSVFFAGIFVSLVLFSVLFAGAPLIARFYSEPILKLVLRVQSLSIVFSALYSVQNAILVRNLQFKKSFIYKLIAISLQGITGISLAVLGNGVWSLVIANIVNSVVTLVSMWFVVEWKPNFIFSFSKLKNLFSFSSRVLLTSLINNVFHNIQSLVIGKSFDSAMVGYYNRGLQIPTLIMTNTDGAINTVMFTVLSKCQDNQERFNTVYRRSIKTSCFVTFPLMIGLIAIAEPFTIILLTEKWLPSVPFMRIICLICMTWPFSIMSQAFNALGKSEISMKLNIVFKVITVILLVISIRYGVYAVAMSGFVSSIITILISAIAVEKILDYKILQQINDVLPFLILSFFMGLIVIAVENITGYILINLILQIMVGIFIYAGGAMILKFETFKYLIDSLKELIRNRKYNLNNK